MTTLLLNYRWRTHLRKGSLFLASREAGRRPKKKERSFRRDASDVADSFRSWPKENRKPTSFKGICSQRLGGDNNKKEKSTALRPWDTNRLSSTSFLLGHRARSGRENKRLAQGRRCDLLSCVTASRPGPNSCSYSWPFKGACGRASGPRRS